MGSAGVGLAIAAVTFALGYAIGSLPLPALVGHAAGVDAYTQGEGNPGAANVWGLAGPGWGLLALAADLARGVLPVALAAVTFSWTGGWWAALGAIVGASWPALGRLRGGRGLGVLAGVLAALGPAAAILAGAAALAVAAGARMTGREGRTVALGVALGTYVAWFALLAPDPPRAVSILALYLVVVVRYATTRH